MSWLPILAIGLLVTLSSSPAVGLPIVSEARTVEGLRCFPDHEDPALWWFLPRGLRLEGQNDGQPGFSFLRYRYKGSASTGDADRFWSRGVLAFEVSFPRDSARLTRARAALATLEGRPVSLRRLPIVRIESVLMYADVRAEDALETSEVSSAGGSLEGGDWESAEGSWDRRVFTLGLDPPTSDLLWESFHREGLALSLSYSLIGKSLASRPISRGGASPVVGGERKPGPPSSEPVAEERALASDSVAIRVSPEECPSCFRSIDLDARIPADYPFLDVFCHDFESTQLPGDLELVVVRVRAVAVNGDRPIEQIEFGAGDGKSKLPVHFRFAVDLEAGYEYQVIREYSSGSRPEPWHAVSSWTGRLDVTRYPTGKSQVNTLDPRRLY